MALRIDLTKKGNYKLWCNFKYESLMLILGGLFQVGWMAWV